jgi:hypothetical protein
MTEAAKRIINRYQHPRSTKNKIIIGCGYLKMAQEIKGMVVSADPTLIVEIKEHQVFSTMYDVIIEETKQTTGNDIINDVLKNDNHE